jgi:hypothetical protein
MPNPLFINGLRNCYARITKVEDTIVPGLDRDIPLQKKAKILTLKVFHFSTIG